MNTPRPINVDQELSDWLEDGPSTAPDETLDGVLNTFPTLPQRRVALRASGGRGFGIVTGLLQVAAVVAVVVGAIVIIPRLVPNGGASSGVIGASPTPTATAVATPVPSAAILVPTPLVASAAPSPAPTAPPTVAPVTACTGADLAAQPLDWQGAAGTRFGTVRVHDAGTTDCLVSGTPGLQLVDGQGSVFLDSANLGGPASVSPAKPVYTLHAGGADSVYLLVGLQNYCGADPVGTVHIDLVLPSSLGGTVGSEVSGVTVSMAPCNGPGQPAVLHVQQGWSTTAP
jgi:hypothetical protein